MTQDKPSCDAWDQLEARADTLESACDDLNAQVDRLKVKLAATEKERDDLRNTLLATRLAEGFVDELTRKLRSEVEKLKGEKAAQEMAVIGWRDAFEKACAEHRKAQQRCDELRKEVKAWSEKCSGQSRLLDSVGATSRARAETIRTLETEVAMLKNDNLAYRDGLGEWKARSAKLSESLKVAGIARDRWRALYKGLLTQSDDCGDHFCEDCGGYHP